MSEQPRYIRNFETVIAAFGYWPSFHDALVLEFEATDDHVILTLHGFETTSQTDNGYFIAHKHHVIRFQFGGIKNSDLAQFIPENVLFELGFSSNSDFEAAGQFTVTLDSAMGAELCGRFSATSGEVLAVLPCDSNGQFV